MASGPDHMRASASSEPLVDREWQATTAVAALTSALDEPHAVAQPAEHVVVRRDSPAQAEASKALGLPKAEKAPALTNEAKEAIDLVRLPVLAQAPCPRSLAGKPVAMAVDVETHGWIKQGPPGSTDENTIRMGEFGHICLTQLWQLSFERMVQVGWCFFDAHGNLSLIHI